ncbi:MAG: hypothetical protein NPMRTH1_570016 [Nitrosopumilales archaeon]|nr:MAG: hypothetical protein NPMRTH1_570016 [Nitrosopumilales archaeon]
MVYQLAVLVIIPIILGIVTISPFEELIREEPIEEPVEITPTEPQNGFGALSFILFTIWIFIVIRMLYKLKRGHLQNTS